MAIGKISGVMLQSNLLRDGSDIAIEGNLLYVDVANQRIGVNTTPDTDFHVNGSAKIGDITLSGNAISTTDQLDLGSIANVRITGGASNYVVSTDGNGNLTWLDIGNVFTGGGVTGNAVQLGTNSLGNLVSNAVTLTSSTSVTDGVAQLNVVLGKLVPASPPTFPNSQTLSISSLSTYRMCDFVQTDRTATGGRSVAGGTSVSLVRRANSYTTSTIGDCGPGDSGTVTVYKNGSASGSRALNTGSDNGTYTDLVIADNVDYGTKTGAATGFWESFDSYASGTVSNGWNEVYIRHSAGSLTNTPYWYYDSSAPGTPTFSSTNTVLTSNVVSYSSTIPHLTSSSYFTLSFNVNKLSGDMYPTSDTFATGTAGGAFAAPSSRTYTQANITTPLIQNLHVSSGNASVTTTSYIISGFGSSSSGPTISVSNSYNTGTQSFPPGATVLYKTGTSTQIEETSMSISASVGTGSGNPYRVVNPGSGDTPTYTANASAFNSQTSTLQTYDATIVGALLKHDQTNYSTGYYPVGPNLSSGRTGGQYYTFKFVRSAVSKFDIKYTGTIAGLWVALPGSTIDSTSTLNGWLDMSTAYAGSGVPGASGGNGSNGCSLGGLAVLNSAVTNGSYTCTFGTVSSSSTATNEIYVRVKLTSGQIVSALTIEAATH